MNKKKTQRDRQGNILKIVETALMIAVAVIFSEFLKFDVAFIHGGSVTFFSQVPIIILAYRYGTPWGLFSGLIMGIFQLFFGFANFGYVNGITAYIVLALFDYILAFGALGLGGMFRNKIKNQSLALSAGGVVTSLIRYLCHIISGATIWAEYGMGSRASIWFAVSYNGGFMIPELIITVIGCAVLGGVFDFRSKNIVVKRKRSRS